MNSRHTSIFTSALLLATGSLVACSTRPDRTTDTAAAAARAMPANGPDSGVGPMPTMPGMQSDSIVTVTEANLSRMDKAGPDSLKALLPRHREVVAALIKNCEDMMRMQKMSPPRKWTKTVADVQQDMLRMASMSAAGVKRAWPDHEQRIRDMLIMRHDMMKSMKM